MPEFQESGVTASSHASAERARGRNRRVRGQGGSESKLAPVPYMARTSRHRRIRRGLTCAGRREAGAYLKHAFRFFLRFELYRGYTIKNI